MKVLVNEMPSYQGECLFWKSGSCLLASCFLDPLDSPCEFQDEDKYRADYGTCPYLKVMN